VAADVRLILEVAAESAVDVQIRDRPPAAVKSGEVAVVPLPADSHGNLEDPGAGELVLSVPAPEALTREPDAVHHVIADAGTGAEPLVVEVEAAEEIRDEELAVVLAAAGRSRRNVILRIVRSV
jgi:hypothetical protein